LELQVSLGKALLALYGYASPRVDRVFARALELCQILANQDRCDPAQLVQILLAQAVFHLMRGSLESAGVAAGQVRQLAEQAGAERIVLTSHLLLGAAALYQADHDSAQVHLEQVLALYKPTQYPDLAYQQGQDPGVQALAFLSRVRWIQGYRQQALELCQQALELSEKLDHPYSSTIAALHAATLRAWLRWWPECQEHAEKALRMARKGGFKMREANAIVLQGIARAHQGHIREGIEGLAQGLYLWEASGAGLVAYGLACLAEAYLLAGQQDEGLRAVEESLYENEETWWLQEQYRLRAELLLLKPGAEMEAEGLLRRAAELARDQQARSLELRALTSLARLQQHQGQKVDAMQRLVQCRKAFMEGLDLPDIREADSLLAKLETQLGREDFVASHTTA
jgi:adenylate cyclase